MEVVGHGGVLRLLFLCGANLSVETESEEYAFTFFRHFDEDLKFKAIDILLTESKRKCSPAEPVFLLFRNRIRPTLEDFRKIKALYRQISQVNLKNIVVKMQGSLVTECIKTSQISSPALINFASIGKFDQASWKGSVAASVSSLQIRIQLGSNSLFVSILLPFENPSIPRRWFQQSKRRRLLQDVTGETYFVID